MLVHFIHPFISNSNNLSSNSLIHVSIFLYKSSEDALQKKALVVPKMLSIQIIKNTMYLFI
ncbi:hypothetical protein HOF65_02965 [bacterium]|jgi:hypothetical protein|nr:hypothetical protein [bacterium]MBT3852958.1 hypothetical protein [bacterium]MBT4633261.1 hypothetical protein [bacterium]MBT6779019.1 hypothetical protein [bacterium]